MTGAAHAATTSTPDAPTGDSRPVRWFWRALTALGVCAVLDTLILCLFLRPAISVLLPGVVGCGVLFLVTIKRTLRAGRPLVPLGGNRMFWTVVALGVLLFVVVEAALIREGLRARPAEDAECMIVLGASVWGWAPSPTLRRRLDAAAEYLVQHPQMPVIVSGGQGPGEDRSEAVAMREYLVMRGIAPQRIRMEAASTTTWENFRYARRLLEDGLSDTSPRAAAEQIRRQTGATEAQEAGEGKRLPRLLVVTSGFHMLRAQLLAQRAGFASVSGLSASSPPELAVNLYGREFVALLKSLLLDRY